MEGGHAHVDANDSFGKKVGLQAAVLAVLLSISTIFAHRAHTETIVMGNEASNEWSHYQAKRIRDFQLELNADLLNLTAAKTPELDKKIESYAAQRAQYSKELGEIKKDAEQKVAESNRAHHQAWRFDLSEGILEIALVLSSLYFLSHKKFFSWLGLGLGLAGATVGIWAFIFTH